MANLKEIRTRITSVNSTMQITSAMKMVSAAKLKRAQNAVVQMRPYAEKLQEILSNVSASIDTADNEFIKPREEKKILVVALSSNRGLCGGFNNNVIKQVKRIEEETNSSSIEVSYSGTLNSYPFTFLASWYEVSQVFFARIAYLKAVNQATCL